MEITILPHCPQLLAEFYKPLLSTKHPAFLGHMDWKPKNSLGFLSPPKTFNCPNTELFAEIYGS